jgi:HEAT repeat protein
MNQSNIIVKMHRRADGGAELRRMQFAPRALTFKSLQDRVGQVWATMLNKSVHIHYHDDEGGAITVASDSDLREACTVTMTDARKSLRLELTMVQAPRFASDGGNKAVAAGVTVESAGGLLGPANGPRPGSEQPLVCGSDGRARGATNRLLALLAKPVDTVTNAPKARDIVVAMTGEHRGMQGQLLNFTSADEKAGIVQFVGSGEIKVVDAAALSKLDERPNSPLAITPPSTYALSIGASGTLELGLTLCMTSLDGRSAAVGGIVGEAREYTKLAVGHLILSVAGKATSALGFAQTVELIHSARRPVVIELAAVDARAPEPVLQDLPAFIGMLGTDCPERQLAATTGLRKLLAAANQPPVQSVIDTGVVPRLVELLQSGDDLLQFEVAWVLTNIASSTSDHTMSVVQAGAVPVLCGLLRTSPSMHVVDQAAWSLGNIAGDSSERRDAVLHAGGVASIVHAIQKSSQGEAFPGSGPFFDLGRVDGKPRTKEYYHSEWHPMLLRAFGKKQADLDAFPASDSGELAPMHRRQLSLLSEVSAGHKLRRGGDKLHLLGSKAPSLLPNLVWALSNLLRGKPLAPLELALPAVPMLAVLLSSSSDAVVTDACWCLSYVCDGPDERIQAMLDAAGVCAPLIGLMKRDSDSVVTAALRAVGNIASGNATQTQALINCGALPCLLSLLASSNQMVRKETCWTIANITAGTTAQIEAVMDAGIMPAIYRLARHPEEANGDPSPAVRKEAAWVIANATDGTAKQQRGAVDLGCVQALCNLLGDPDVNADAKVVTALLSAVVNLVALDKHEQQIPSIATLLGNYGGWDRVTLISKEHEDSDIRQLATSLVTGTCRGGYCDHSPAAERGTTVRHDGIACKGCESRAIQGTRFMSAVVPNFDLCARCEANGAGLFEATHAPFLKINRPCQVPARLNITLAGEGEGTGLTACKMAKPEDAPVSSVLASDQDAAIAAELSATAVPASAHDFTPEQLQRSLAAQQAAVFGQPGRVCLDDRNPLRLRQAVFGAPASGRWQAQQQELLAMGIDFPVVGLAELLDVCDGNVSDVVSLVFG